MSDEETSKVVQLDMKDKERLATLEIVATTTKRDLKYLYEDFKEHRKDDAQEFNHVRDIMHDHELLLSGIQATLEALTIQMAEHNKTQKKFLKIYSIGIGIFSTISALIGISWAILKLIMPLLT